MKYKESDFILHFQLEKVVFVAYSQPFCDKREIIIK